MAKSKHNKKSFSDPASQCRCAEDDNCGCTYPENITDSDDLTMSQKSFKIKTEERFIVKDSVCYCSPKNCDCKIEYHESDY